MWFHSALSDHLSVSPQHVLVFLQVVAFGKCGHMAICADCVLHMVLLSKKSDCPLCKADLDQVSSIP